MFAVPEAQPHAAEAVRRIVHLRTVKGQGGGPEKTILNSPRFIGPGYEMSLVYLRPRRDPAYDLPTRASQLGVDLIDIPETGPFDPRALWQLVQLVRASKPDILHAHDYKTNVLAIALRRWCDAVAMTTMHGSGVWGRRVALYYRLDRWSLPRMDFVVAVSPDQYETAMSYGVCPSRCTMIHNAIDGAHFRRTMDASLVRNRLGLPLDRVIIGAVGRLSREKGFDNLIAAVHLAAQKGQNLHLIIAGDGDERIPLTQLIAKLGCHDRVQLLGHRSDIIELFHCMDIFVLSSHREALPNVVLEAMALEVPVIATRVAGVPDVIQDQQNGLLTDPGDCHALADSITQLAENRSLRARLSAAARKTIEERFSFAHRMEKMRDVYDRVLGRG